MVEVASGLWHGGYLNGWLSGVEVHGWSPQPQIQRYPTFKGDVSGLTASKASSLSFWDVFGHKKPLDPSCQRQRMDS